MRLLFVMFGWEDSGGGTMLPRAIAKALASRGHEVRVFHAGVGRLPDDSSPYRMLHREDAGVRLHGLYHRRVAFHAVDNPLLDLDDPPVREAFEDLLDTWRPDAAHVHNLHGLGASLLTSLSERGIPTWFTPHNHWVACPSLYLLDARLDRCDGPGNGSACGSCNKHPELAAAFVTRRAGLRETLIRTRTTLLAPSTSVRDVLIQQGIPSGQIRLLFQGHEPFDKLWNQVGAHRLPATPTGPVRFGTLGTVSALKGIRLIAAATHHMEGAGTIDVFGDVTPELKATIEADAAPGRLRIHGAYKPGDLPDILARIDVMLMTSISDDCAPLAIWESHAARVPVLGARIGGIPDFIRDGTDGLLFPARDPKALAHAMNRVMATPELVATWQAAIRPPRGFGDYLDRLEDLYAGKAPPQDACARPTALRIVLESTANLGTINLSESRDDLEVEILDRHGARIAGQTLSKPPDISLQNDPPRQGLWFAHAGKPNDPEVDGVLNTAEIADPVAKWAGWRGRTPRRYRTSLDLTDSGPALELPDAPGRRLLLCPEWQEDPWSQAVRQFLAAIPAGLDLALVLLMPPGRPDLQARLVACVDEEADNPVPGPDIVLVDAALTGSTIGSLYRACDALWSLGQPNREEEARACGLPVLHRPMDDDLRDIIRRATRQRG
ncbi:MAG: glycosyltransferase [Candidatus Sericytochromatia bacterium]|nr:glycosyltransferase [Candidatus Tanganyikabacteria bacterium]